MRMIFNFKGKWRLPTVHLQGIPRDVLGSIMYAAEKELKRELVDRPGGITADWNRHLLGIIGRMDNFMRADTFPGKRAEIDVSRGLEP